MKDFTINSFHYLLASFKNAGFRFISFESYINNKNDKVVIVRHDIDDSKFRALKFAELENSLGIKASYYFRIKKCSFNKDLIKEVASLGHEIGYHYEDLSLNKGDYEKAIKSFERNLVIFRKLYPVKTICMHGRALSKIDNRTLWQKYDYRKYGITGEPYFDLDFNKVLYLTDTGQSWSGSKYSIRDKVKSSLNFQFKSTFDIINNINKLPDQIMITCHPDRWAFNSTEWYLINAHMKIRDKLKRILFYNRSESIFK
jgi:hypothetical protein